MKHVDEFRDAQRIRAAADELRRLADSSRTYRIMEICGGHTHAIYRFGLDELLPRNVELIHGPGCPVCVLPVARIDKGLSLTDDPRMILTAFGDLMRVPGSNGSLLAAKARGRDIRVVYSPLDALNLARAQPERIVVFFAIGFETTAPSTALTVLRARALGVQNFLVFCNHVTIVPPLRALLEMPELRIEGFVGPGHVSTVIGCRPYEFIAREYGKPVVVSGFEPLDLLQAIAMLIRQLNEGRVEVINNYRRAVAWEGNAAALRALEQVFEDRDEFEWRGLGSIPVSGLRLRDAFADFDAERRLTGPSLPVLEVPDARCGAVLTGTLKPNQCPLFGKECTPEQPVGALMVSSEGSCAAYYNYVARKDQTLSGARV